MTSIIAGGAPLPSPVAATSVPLTAIAGIAADKTGNFYFTASNSVFKLDSTGTLTLIAGNSLAGFSGDGGPAVSAQLNSPSGIALDTAGDIFIADTGNQRVRRVSPGGIIATVAGGGNGTPFVEGSAATKTTLGRIGGLALDASGDLLIADSGYAAVRMVSPKGIASTIAGTGAYGYSGDGGPATQAVLSDPSGLAIDQLGNIFIADTENNCIRKVSASGTITTFAGTGFAGFSGDNGLAVSAQLNLPAGVAFDGSGNLLIADTDNGRIRKVSSSGMITTIAGNGIFGSSGDGGPAISAELANVFAIAVDGAGNILISASKGQNANAQLFRSGTFVNPTLVLNPVTVFPVLGFVDSVGPAGGSVLRKISPAATINTVAGNGASNLYGIGGPATSANFGSIRGVAADNNGNVFIADMADDTVLKISAAGIVTVAAGNGKYGFAGDGGLATQAELAFPMAVATDSAGDLFIADQDNGRIRKVSPAGIITTVAGNGDAGYAGDGGLAINAEIARPSGIAVDGSGNLFILDTNNSVVRKVASNGIITTFAGTGATGFSGDNGPASKATLYDPMGIAIDAAGNLYIADTYNFAVREVSASSGIITVAGGTSQSLSEPTSVAVDGAGNLFISEGVMIQRLSATGGGPVTIAPSSVAELAFTSGIAADTQGNVYISDEASNSVRKLTPTSQPVAISAVVDAASELPGAISPGEIIVIYGNGFGIAPGGATVTMNGIKAPVFFASPTQVNAVVPYEVSGATVGITVDGLSGISAAYSVPLVPTSPAFFTYNASGAGEAAAFNVVDGTLNSATNPVKIGGYIEMFFTGGGQTSPGGIDGKLATIPLPSPLAAVSASIGGIPATVQYKGDVSGVVDGFMQLNLLVPPGITPGGYVPVVLTVGNEQTVSGAVWIAVSN